MIKLQVIGNLGKDAVKNEVNGKTVLNFSLAHTEKFRSGDEQKEKTIWVECAYWTDKTGILPYLTKGAPVYVEGTPDIRTWQKDGNSGASLVVRVLNIQLLGGRQEGAKETQHAKNYNNITEPVDDLPF